MPKPAILPTIDWRAVHQSGDRYDRWIAMGESEDNRQQMEDALEGLSLDPDLDRVLANLPRPVYVVAFAEDWCGDVVRHVPALRKLAKAAPQLKVRFIRRDQHPDVFVRFLTNGGEAIPKFIFLSDRYVECGNWGPMPSACRELIARGKACGDIGATREKISALYAADPGLRIVIEELAALIDIASSTEP